MQSLIQTIPHYNPTRLTFEGMVARIPPLHWDAAEALLGACQVFLEQTREQIRRDLQQQVIAFQLNEFYSLCVDRLIKVLADHFFAEHSDLKKDEVALLATGGYGRKELSLASDVDLLFLFSEGQQPAAQKFCESVLYVLWDLKLDVGHACRSVEEQIQAMTKDHTIMTSSMDARWLWGSQRLWPSLVMERTRYLRQGRHHRQLIHDKLQDRMVRLKKFGGSVFVLEPNLKEGEGGLRDLQLARWLIQFEGRPGTFGELGRRGLISDETQLHFSEAHEFFLELRNHLADGAFGRRDQLSFAAQEHLARHYGFVDDGPSLAAEKFMQLYYGLAERVKIDLKMLMQKMHHRQLGMGQKFLLTLKRTRLDADFEILDQKIHLQDGSRLKSHPSLLLKIFLHVQATGLGIHFRTKELFRLHLPIIDESYRRLPQHQAWFRQIMGDLKNLGRTLFSMHEVRFFDAFLPEFKPVRNRMQHDAYHVYTVDTHSLFAVDQLTLLLQSKEYQAEFPEYREVLQKITRHDLLSLGVLLHDIGKGEGGDHSVIGAKIAQQVMERLGYDGPDQQAVEFLVLSHLLMPRISQRRDLEDQHMIQEFAHSMGSLHRLDQLYILTWADIRAVSAEAWTKWKGELLTSLYQKTKAVLLTEGDVDLVRRKRVVDAQRAVVARMTERLDAQALENFLRSMSGRYVFAFQDDDIVQHFHWLQQHDHKELMFREVSSPDANWSALTIYTMNNPRVLSLITGVLLALDINILSLECFFQSDGHVLITMNVQTLSGECLAAQGKGENLHKLLREVFMGQKNVEHLLEKKRRSGWGPRGQAQVRRRSKILIDNDVSAYYTVIDLLTQDRVGLLYDVVQTLGANGCYVELSKILTKADQVVDSFYVKDIFGQKILSKGKLEQLKQRLMDVVDGTGQEG